MKGKIDFAMMWEMKGILFMLYLYQALATVLWKTAENLGWPRSKTVNFGDNVVRIFDKINDVVRFFSPVFKPFFWLVKFIGGIILGIVCVIVIICTSIVAYIREYIIKKKEVNAHGC